MFEKGIRQAATVLIEAAIRIAPADARDWGRAILGELGYVEGQWAVGMWALGGAAVLVRQALVSLVIPGRFGQGSVPDGGMFAKSATLRRAALVSGAICWLAALLFFAAPPFRQAFQVALKPWRVMHQVASGTNSQPGFTVLAQRAEGQHDAEGLAFCAIRVEDPQESARLAEEAVRLDPGLVWIYAVVAMHHPAVRPAAEWATLLEQRDPQNALPYLIAAESTHFRHPESAPPAGAQEQAGQDAMAAAFRSPRFDDFSDRVTELNRRVVARYGFYDPYEVESREGYPAPVFLFDNSERFAQALLAEGTDLDSRSDHRRARERYWSVVQFGQMLDSQGSTEFERSVGIRLQTMAYRRLQAVSANEGQPHEAALFAYLAAKFDAVKGSHLGIPESAFGRETAERNAAVVQVAGLMMLIFAALATIALSVLIAGNRRRAGSVSHRAKPVAAIVVLSSGVGLLFSAVTLYLTYRPYWYIFRSATLSGGGNQIRDLHAFLNATKIPPGTSHYAHVFIDSLLYAGSPGFLFYFWTGVTLVGLIGLTLILLRQFLSRPANTDSPTGRPEIRCHVLRPRVWIIVERRVPPSCRHRAR